MKTINLHKNTVKNSQNIDNNENGENTTVFHIVERYISKKYDIRFNEISLDIEWKLKSNEKWESCNENTLWVELRKKNIAVGISGLKSLLKSDFVTRFNPLEGYFNSLPEWDGEVDYIEQYAGFVKLAPEENREQFVYHFKKWIVRAVKCALIEGYFNKQAFVLTDDGNRGQNMGKSTWCRYLCPPDLSKYIAEDISLNDKDTRVMICKNFLINLDELAVLSKKEINQLKSLFSKDKVNERLPYDSKNTILPRIASFIGSTNQSTFLHDETGSVRWLCFVVESIDWTYNSKLNPFDINNLWMQAYALSKDQNFNSDFTREDVVTNEARNEKFQYISNERELIQKCFEPSDKESGVFLTASEITLIIKPYSGINNINPIQVGKALKSLNFFRTKTSSGYGYYVKHNLPQN